MAGRQVIPIDEAVLDYHVLGEGVGEDGELEHAAAILHPKMGAPVRKVLGKGAALAYLALALLATPAAVGQL